MNGGRPHPGSTQNPYVDGVGEESNHAENNGDGGVIDRVPSEMGIDSYDTDVDVWKEQKINGFHLHGVFQ